jgi:hypothetical protein
MKMQRYICLVVVLAVGLFLVNASLPDTASAYCVQCYTPAYTWNVPATSGGGTPGTVCTTCVPTTSWNGPATAGGPGQTAPPAPSAQSAPPARPVAPAPWWHRVRWLLPLILRGECLAPYCGPPSRSDCAYSEHVLFFLSHTPLGGNGAKVASLNCSCTLLSEMNLPSVPCKQSE